MIIQEPIKATIWFALENYAYSDAIFLSERLFAEINNDEHLFLLATSYYRSGKHNVAHSILSRNKYNPLKSPNCHFLRAKCCFHLGKIQEATNLLLELISDDILIDKKILFTKEDLTKVYGESSSFVAQLLGQLFHKLEDFETAAHYYTLSLKINPFLWSSYEKLLQIDPAQVDQDKLFNIDSFDSKYSCGTNPLINLFNSSPNFFKTAQSETPKSDDNAGDPSHYFATPEVRKNSNNKSKIELSTPYAILKQSPSTSKVDVITPETDGNWNMMTCLAPSKNNARNGRKFIQNIPPSSQVLIETSNLGVNRNLLAHMESSSHSFGVLSLDTDSVNVTCNDQNDGNASKICDVARQLPRRIHKESSDVQSIIDDPIKNPNTKSSVLTRRSSRLNSDTGSIKENSTSPTKKIDRRVTPLKRCRPNINFEKSSKIIKANNENSASSKVITHSLDVTKTGVKAQRSSANGLLELIKKVALAYKRLMEYRCKEAIEHFKRLPSNHYNTGFVLATIGRCYFEMGQYEESVNFFKMCRHLEPYRLQGLEIYSTSLWHLQNELELSCLSQELIQFDKLAPETWCVAGNCFSLQKDHEISIKFLKRAIQVDPNFAYAYTLLGHELISADELDNAMSCFTNATRIDPRHYNAWCGIGLICYKQEKYDSAKRHYKRALDISKYNPILMCHLAIVKHHLDKSKEAINLLNEASKIDPNNVLIKYHRASIRFYLEEYALALDELEELKKMVPKESIIYFLIGKIHKIRGETHLAVCNFSWAVHIDPKGSANQYKEFNEPYQTPNDEFLVPPYHGESSSSTTPVATPFTLRSTYITGPISGASNYNNISLNEPNISDLIDAEIEDDNDLRREEDFELSLEARMDDLVNASEDSMIQ